MLDRILMNIADVDKIGLFILIIAGVITYGAKFIAQNIFKVKEDRMLRTITLLKLGGLLVGVFGFLRITQII